MTFNIDAVFLLQLTIKVLVYLLLSKWPPLAVSF